MPFDFGLGGDLAGDLRGRVRFAAPIARAWLTDLNEKRGRELKITKSNAVPIAAGPQRIVTIEVRTGKRA